MKPYTTSERLKQIMDARGMKQADIVRAVQPYADKYGLKFGKSILSHYVSGDAEPGQDKLTLLGLALNVSEVWLMGYDVPMERSAKPATGKGNGRVDEFVELFKLLTPTQQNLVIAQIRGILERK